LLEIIRLKDIIKRVLIERVKYSLVCLEIHISGSVKQRYRFYGWGTVCTIAAVLAIALQHHSSCHL